MNALLSLACAFGLALFLGRLAALAHLPRATAYLLVGLAAGRGAGRGTSSRRPLDGSLRGARGCSE